MADAIIIGAGYAGMSAAALAGPRRQESYCPGSIRHDRRQGALLQKRERLCLGVRRAFAQACAQGHRQRSVQKDRRRNRFPARSQRC